MNLWQFLKPSKKKVAIYLIVFSVLVLLLYNDSRCFGCEVSMLTIILALPSFVFAAIPFISLIFPWPLGTIVSISLVFFYWYLIACIVALVYDRLRNRKQES
jgi:hypothetical protein